jgi:adenylylsulfate kinase
MDNKGCVIWFTGVAASGKSTVAALVERELRQRGIPVENLDADEVRANLSPDLKWSLQDRDLNTKRLAFLANLLARHGVIGIVAAVSSLRRYRDRARSMTERFVEVWTTCKLETCKQRDPKGLYARGERGEVNDIAGWHQPFEEPLQAELVLDTDALSPEECTREVMVVLEKLGYIPARQDAPAAEKAADTVYSEADEEKIKERLRNLGYL